MTTSFTLPMLQQKDFPHLTIQDWARLDRPREKMMQKGPAALTNAELLGILMGSGTNKISAVNLAQVMLKHYEHDLNKLAKCSVKELQRFKGIGEAKATSIASAMELGRRRSEQAVPLKPRLYDSKSSYNFIKSELLDKPVEEFWVMLINSANYLVRKHFVSSGGVTSTLADPKVIFKIALDHQTAGIILAHNHPSGIATPSTQDIALTKKLIDGGKLLDIAILDHIIIAGSTYFSFADDKLLFDTFL